MVHVIYPNHSKQFYDYLALYMAYWEKRKDILEKGY
nr:YgjP-like metallopeptidase domain-containing protein [Sulfurimonas denitrificans]